MEPHSLSTEIEHDHHTEEKDISKDIPSETLDTDEEAPKSFEPDITPPSNNKYKFIIGGIAAFLLLVAASYFMYAKMFTENSNEPQTNEVEPVTESTPNIVKSDEPDSYGINPEDNTRPYITNTVPQDPVVTPTTPTTVETVQAEISLTGPTIKENDKDVSYTYTLKYNVEARNLYQAKVIYDIDPEGCTVDESIKSTMDFDGELTNLASTQKTFTITIDENFLSSKTNLVNSSYSLLDKNSKSIATGNVKVPSCLGSDEDNENGEFSVEGPDLDKELRAEDDRWHFDWSYEMDSEARNLLEKGFTIKIKHDCSKWMEEGYKGDWGGEWGEGEMDGIGYGVNVHEDAFDGVDSDDLYVRSTYKVYDHDDDLVFSGFVKVPNCR